LHSIALFNLATQCEILCILILAGFLVQKAAQLDEDAASHLHDVCLLWLHVKEVMEVDFAKPIILQHEELFMKGNLGIIDLAVAKNLPGGVIDLGLRLATAKFSRVSVIGFPENPSQFS